MSAPRRASPCVGICSTTYGDLVCRGCKRYAHEIVHWNSYESDQKEVIWQRLDEQQRQIVDRYLTVADPVLFQQAIAERSLATGDWRSDAYELLRRIVRKDQQLSAFGLLSTRDEMPILELLQEMDSAIYERSLATYEQSYRVPPK